MFEDVFVFAEHQQKATYGLGYKLTLIRNQEHTVLDKAAGVNDARSKTNQVH